MLLRHLWKGGRLVPCRTCGTEMDMGRTILVEDNKGTKPWRTKVKAAGILLRDKAGGPIGGPVGIDVTFTLERPKTIPLAKRAWPHVTGSNDIDKLCRCLLDGLQDARVFADDAQVCELVARKAYPDTPGCPDRLNRPGALIRVWPL
jgi:Holliday junction resolvase RusA-like endonuclease